MKTLRLILCITVVTFGVISSLAQSISAEFLEDLVNSGQTQVAIEELTQYVESNMSFEGYYNLAYLYELAENPTASLINYIYAFNIMPRDLQVTQKISELDYSRALSEGALPYRVLGVFRSILSTVEHAWIAFVSWCLLCIIIAMLLSLNKHREVLFSMLVSFGFLFVSLFSSYVFRTVFVSSHQEAVLVRDEQIMNGAGASYLTMGSLQSPAIVYVVGVKDNYYQIELANGRGGWVPDDSLIILQNK